jgi:hypothetical protein
MLFACKKLSYEHIHTHTQYLKIIALLRWPWLGEDAKMLRYTYSAGFACKYTVLKWANNTAYFLLMKVNL